MGWIKRCGVWLSRIGHAQGFGIQSPHDYRFVREVIGEKNPYYAYKAIAKQCKGENRRCERLCRLYFRVANNVQPDVVMDICSENNFWVSSMHMGCLKSQRLSIAGMIPTDILWQEDKKYLIWVNVSNLSRLLPAISQIPDGSVLIVQDIYRDDEVTSQWNLLVECDEPRIVFDLYHCAILFFDKKRYKEYYTINY
jgi:hypothetical protein